MSKPEAKNSALPDVSTTTAKHYEILSAGNINGIVVQVNDLWAQEWRPYGELIYGKDIDSNKWYCKQVVTRD